MARQVIVGLGGTTSAGSSTEQALGIALASAERKGAEVCLYGGRALAQLPHYQPGAAISDVAQRFLSDVRRADGLIIASPGYHGSISGLVKNAIDYLEETARDGRVYLDGMPVGLIVTAYGSQALGSTLMALRSIVHALRGWPTPLGAAVNTTPGLFRDGTCSDPNIAAQLAVVGQQVWDFAAVRSSAPDMARAGD